MASGLFCVAGKNVLITGGTRGIGYMIASTFVEHGANVLITSRDPKACEEAASSLLALRRHAPSSSSSSSSSSSYVHHVPSNVSTREGCKALASHVRDVFSGRLDVLVNNAGASWGEDPGYDPDSRESGRMNWGWDKVLDLNVKGLFYLTRECVPMLQRRGEVDDAASSSSSSSSHSHASDPGRIINVGSVTGLMPQDAPTHAYDVSKAAVHHLTKKLASDLAPRGITVNAIAPGYLLTRMSKGLLSTWATTTTKNDVDGSDGGGSTTGRVPIPLGRMGNGDDMGGACIYLSSRAGSWITGVILTVDGGLVGAARIPLSNL